MKFESLDQTIASIGMLQKFYPVIRILDADSKEILYDSQNSDMPPETPVSCTGCYDAFFSISENSRLTVITVTIPVSICGHSCHLELIQSAKKQEDSHVPAEQKMMFKHIRKLAVTDSLTSLYNRRYIDEQLPIDLTHAFQKNKPLSVIYADIDCFKKINDKYGHIIGDHVLKEVSGVFCQQLRKKDGWIARYGGDEILICLPGISEVNAVRIANRIRSAVEKRNFCIHSYTLKITCSFGVQTVYKESGVNTVDKIVELADIKLYQAKKKGRNRVWD